MTKLKILLLNTQMEAAGAQKAMLTLARGLQQRGHTVTVATMYDKAEYVPLFRQQYGVNIVDLQMKPSKQVSKIKKVVAVLKGVRRLMRLMQQEKFDVLQTFSHYSNILGPLLAYISGVRVRVSSQRMSLKGSPRWLLLLDRWMVNSFLVNKMVSVSEGTRRFSIEVQKMRPEKLLTIHNSIDLDRFSPVAKDSRHLTQLRQDLGLPEHALVVIVVARLHVQKGHRFLIESLPSIHRTFPRAHFLFVGEGELRQDLEDRVKQTGVEEIVHFLGMRQDIPELLTLSDLFVLPSLWEGLPNSVLEAMAMGTPVIATNVDGCPEVIRDGETGTLIPAEDSAALAQAIIRLLGDAVMRQQFAQAGQRWVVENFSEEKNISAFEQLYESLIMAKA
ncbi:MAG TPA: glycosyltransferase [Anaerolineae bacterium]|nr:glycosyltransferase [Anaerolineae bacterium]